MADQLAVKGQRDRSHIVINDRDNARKWAKHFKISEEDLRRIVERVGNSVGTVRKECDFAKKAQMENKKAPAQATPGTNRSKPGAAPRPQAGESVQQRMQRAVTRGRRTRTLTTTPIETSTPCQNPRHIRMARGAL